MTLRSGIIIRAAGGFYDVETETETVRCTMRGRLKRIKRRTDLCVIGDQVVIDGDERPTVEEILPRVRVFSRRHPGRSGAYQEDVLIANLDRLLIVFAHGDPPLRPRMLDRFLIICEHNDLEAIVIANKQDQQNAECSRIFDNCAALGYQIVKTSAKTGEGIEMLQSLLAGHISAFVGPSGVGKSSLLNAIDPELSIRVAETSESHGKGRHTTRVATLHPLAGGHVADTPGIRELGAWALPMNELDHCFVEMRPFLGQCAFGDCRHDPEPRCAVKAMVGSAISEERYASYLRLLHPEPAK